MRRLSIFQYVCVVLIALAGLATILATGGGGGGSSTPISSAGTGTVAVTISDGPLDAYDSITLYIQEVSLIPADGSRHVAIFRHDPGQHPDGCPVNILAYREDDFLLTVNRRVPAKRYEKIRLTIGGIEAVAKPGMEDEAECDDLEIRLPSGRIDLNPRGSFYVREGESLGIRLDFDANKSVNFHLAGNSGRCIFRPVIFVDIENLRLNDQCPVIVTGTIHELITADSETVGFHLQLAGDGDLLEVLLGDGAAIFGEDGTPGFREDLAPGQPVWVRGMLEDDGGLTASMILVAPVESVEGIVRSGVDGEGSFLFEPEQNDEFPDDFYVQLFEESLVLVSCDEEVRWEAILNGRAARILGKYYSGESNGFRAAVVFLGAQEVSGMITAVSPATGGQDITIQTPEDTLVTVFVSDFTPVYLENDRRVSNGFLCDGKEVRIPLDLYEPDPVAQRVMIQTEEVQGQVTSSPGDGDESRILVINGYTVVVEINAEIIRCGDTEQEYINFDDIQAGDQVRIFGLMDCEDEALFHGYTVQVMEYEQ